MKFIIAIAICIVVVTAEAQLPTEDTKETYKYNVQDAQANEPPTELKVEVSEDPKAPSPVVLNLESEQEQNARHARQVYYRIVPPHFLHPEPNFYVLLDEPQVPLYVYPKTYHPILPVKEKIEN